MTHALLVQGALASALLTTAKAADTGTPEAAAAPLSPGRYGMVLETATIQKLPVVGRTKGGTRGWVLVDLVQTPAGLEQHMTTCEVIVTGMRGSESRVEVPDAFVAAIPKNRRPVALSAAAPDTWTYTVDLGEDVVGWDPARSPEMPTSADHPAVVDFEGDGHPGATMELRLPVFGSVSLFVVQHAHISLRGRLTADGVVRGGVDYHRLEQATVGATHAFFTATPPMEPDPSRSGFVLRPLPAAVGCDQLRTTLCAAGDGC